MYQTVVILKAIVEIAGLALLGQGVLFVLAGQHRHKNMFYGILKTVTAPLFKATRFIAPRFIVDQHIGFLAFFLLMVLWVALTITKIKLVLAAS
jgi:ABC-type uncharacterized transport system permease subunit